MNGWAFLGIMTLICIGVFLNGLRFARITENPWAGRRLFGLPIRGSEMPIEQVRRMGRLHMIVAPLFWLLTAALCFGLLGPVQGIETITLGAGGRS